MIRLEITAVLRTFLQLSLLALLQAPVFAQSPTVKWEELTAADFAKAIQQSQGTCILPIGILEKHGPHLPLGTDLLNIRYISVTAAQQEFAVVFPEYYFGQIFEARHEPGTVAYSAKIQLELLQETTDEMARNGCKKIVIANGHGGNESLLPYFAQTQLAMPHDYVLYVFPLPEHLDQPGRPSVKNPDDMHAGETETSHLMISRPDLVHLDRAKQESGADQKRLNLPDTLYTAIWWYARFPNHYAGVGSAASVEEGKFSNEHIVKMLVQAVRNVKNDQVTPKIQKENYDRQLK
jgi:creatinine amidohydrolase